MITIVGALGTLGYVIATPKVGERFTEFYILGLSGKAIDYPTELVVGEERKLIVGIINREREAATYRIEVVIDGVKNNEVLLIYCLGFTSITLFSLDSSCMLLTQ